MRHGARSLLRSPGFTVSTIVVLALAVGANTALFSVIEAVLLRPLPYRDAQHLVVLWKTVPAKSIEWDWTSGPIVQDWRDRSHAFQDFAIYLRPEGSLVTWSTEDGPEKLQASKTQGSFFELMGVRPELGRGFSQEESRRGDALAVLSHGFWQRRFGADPGILGQSLSLDGAGFTIVGVMPAEFQFPDPHTALWMPLASDARWALWQQPTFRMADAFGGLARLKPDVSVSQARAEMNSVAESLAHEHRETDGGLGVSVIPLAEQIAGTGLRRSLGLLQAALLCVLLIAGFNIAGLLTVRGRHRQRELAIRAALGAGRWRMVRQLAVENLLLFGTSGLCGLLAAAWSLRALLAMAPAGVPRLEGASIHFLTFGFTFALSAAAGVIFGGFPAMQATTIASRSGRGTPRLRRSLVTAQFALAVILLGAAGLLLRSMRLLLEVNPGFDTTHLLTMQVELPAARYANEDRIHGFIEQAIERIDAVPGVREAAAGSASIEIFSGQTPDQSIVTEETPGAPDVQRHQRDLVSDGYFHLMGIPLRLGRVFNAGDVHDGAQVAVVNETMVRRYWPGESPLGKRFQEVLPGAGGAWLTVVGVVGDASRNRNGSINPAFYRPMQQWSLPRMEMVIRTVRDSGSVAAAIRAAMRSLDASIPPFELVSVEQHLRELDAPRRFETRLAGVFAAFALLLAALGLHGLMSSAIEQRAREIGVRVALGATQVNVMRVVVGEGLLCALAGSAAGLAGAVATGRILSSWLFGVTAADPMTLFSVTAILGVVSIAVSGLSAVRSTRIDPVSALRKE